MFNGSAWLPVRQQCARAFSANASLPGHQQNAQRNQKDGNHGWQSTWVEEAWLGGQGMPGIVGGVMRSNGRRIEEL
eukprot:1161643-Pelagomonas_calceolata.AAC.3